MPKEIRMLRFYHDPGHGWLGVPAHDLETLGIADQVSGYSYKGGIFAYLEEDCDAPLYIRAAETKGWKLYITDDITNDNSPIRNMARYTYPNRER